MATQTRIYKVAPAGDGGAARLVRATHPSHALRHVAADAFTVISLARQYTIRRWFNASLHRAAERLAGAAQ